MSTSNPQLVPEHNHRKFVPLLPDDSGFQLRPFPAVSGKPHVAPIGATFLRPAPGHPHKVSIDSSREPEPCWPRSIPGHLCPAHAILRIPNVVMRFIAGHIVPSAEHPYLSVVNHCLMISARRP